MQNDMWMWLFRQVPAEQHNQLMIVTSSSTEIAVQSLLRVETEFVAIKGRLAGSQDAGRVFFIPFANIDYFGLQRDVKEAEFDAIFGAGPLTVVAPVSISEPALATPAIATTEIITVPMESAPVSTAVSHKTPLPLKSEVLERFRSRIASATLSQTNPISPPSDG